MRHITLSIILLALSCLPAFSQVKININTGDKLPDSVSTLPTRIIETVDDGILVTYYFENVYLDSVTTPRETFKIGIESFTEIHEAGAPCVPIRNDLFEVPSNTSLSIQDIEYSECFMELCPSEEYKWEINGYEKAANEISVGDSYFPKEWARVLYQQQYKEKNICSVSLSPIRYNHPERTVYIANKISYKLNFESIPSNSRQKVRSYSSEYESPIAYNAIANYSVPSEYIYDLPGDYLILTTSKFKESVQKFADWKKALGFNVYVCSPENWNSDSDVKDYIDDFYSMHPQLKYLLIVGGHSDVPGMLCYNNYPGIGYRAHVTDYYYGCVSSNHSFDVKFMPDFCRGRIPASNNSDAQNAFNKIIAYELCEGNPNFFDTSLHCSSFEGTGITETRRFIQTSEEIVAAAQENNNFPIRVYNYKNISAERPLRFYDGSLLTGDLLNQNFNWSGNAADIHNAQKNGLSYIMYRGHGGVSGWANPTYKISDVLKESRENSIGYSSKVEEYILPVTFSIACETGAYDKDDCFATTSLVQPHVGSSCIIAASELTLSQLNDHLAIGIVDAFYPGLVKTPLTIRGDTVCKAIPLYRIGQIFDQGLISQNGMSSQYEKYHCFGDPSMMMRTKLPTYFENAKVTLDPETNLCSVSTGEGPAFISFYDKNVDKVECHYGESAQFKFSQIHTSFRDKKELTTNENVIISAPNKVPYIKNTWTISETEPKVQFTMDECYIKDGGTLEVSSNAYTNDNILIISNPYTGVEFKRLSLKNQHETIDILEFNSSYFLISLVVDGNLIDSIILKN